MGNLPRESALDSHTRWYVYAHTYAYTHYDADTDTDTSTRYSPARSSYTQFALRSHHRYDSCLQLECGGFCHLVLLVGQQSE